MKHGRFFYWVLLMFFGVVLLVSFQHALSQESAEELYEAAVFKKESDGDLNGAIQILLRLIKEFPENRKMAAKAQLQIGIIRVLQLNGAIEFQFDFFIQAKRPYGFQFNRDGL